MTIDAQTIVDYWPIITSLFILTVGLTLSRAAITQLKVEMKTVNDRVSRTNIRIDTTAGGLGDVRESLARIEGKLGIKKGDNA